MKQFHFIYETENLINGKLYRGKHSTDNMDDGYLGSGIAIVRAINKYGEENFKRTILVMCKDVHIAYFHEVLYVSPEWVNRDDTYNLAPGGLGGYGFKHSDETKQKLAEMNKGKTASAETKAKMSASSKGRENAIKARDKISKALMGRTLSEEHKQAVSKTLTGYKHTDEAKRNMSKGQFGTTRPHTPTGKANISKGRKGIVLETVTCPYCNKTGRINGMKQWHFDKCKYKV